MASTKVVASDQVVSKEKEQEKLPTARGEMAVIGLGYVGLPLALLAAEKNYRVTGIEINPRKVEQISSKIAPYDDPAISEKLKSTTMRATTDFSALKTADVIVICVPTPVYENHMPNLEPVESASRRVGEYLEPGQLVVLESTVNPGVSETVVLPILEQESGLKAGKDFYLAHCPERINPGDSKWNVRNIPRVVGSLEPVGLKKAVTFYESIIEAPIKAMNSLKEAESVKIIENSFRDINLAFVNEIAMSFSRLGIDVYNVIEGAATKPFAFMPHYPGCGVGGHCIPVDPYYLIDYAKKNGFRHNFLSLARRINNYMPRFTVGQLENILADRRQFIRDVKVAVLGLAYKADIDDCRESPSFKIIERLKELGANVISFDPHVPNRSEAKTLDEALVGADAVILATGHSEFINDLTPERLKKHNITVVVDGRNCLKKEEMLNAGITYRGIGR